jgi:hypothetical protein
MVGAQTSRSEFAAQLVAGRGKGVGVSVRLLSGRIVIETPDGEVQRDFHTDDVAEVHREGSRITIDVVRGNPAVLDAERAEALDAALVDACCTVPELTRALHSLGSSRARSNAAGQREFLAPLLDARRRAEESVGRAAVVAAFDADKIGRALDAYVAALATRSRDERPAARRAFAAAADDAVDPMRAALGAVRGLAAAASRPPEGERVGSWRRWRRALEALFSAADRSWVRLDSGLIAGGRSST